MSLPAASALSDWRPSAPTEVAAQAVVNAPGLSRRSSPAGATTLKGRRAEFVPYGPRSSATFDGGIQAPAGTTVKPMASLCGMTPAPADRFVQGS